MKITHLLLLSFSLSACIKQNNSVDDIAKKLYDNYFNDSVITYHVTYKYYTEGSQDTTKFIGKVALERNLEDTLFNGRVWFDLNDTKKYYDLKNIFTISNNEDSIIKYDAHNGQKWAIDGNISSYVKDIYFLNPKTLLEVINDTINKCSLVSSKSKYIILIKYPSNKYFTDIMDTIKVNKNSFFIESITSISTFQGNREVHSFSFSGHKLLSSFTDFQNQFKALKSSKPIKFYKEAPIPELLKIGQKIKNFKGINIHNDSIELSDIDNDFIILDFWFKGCAPCLEAIPALVEIDKKYDYVSVVGINSMDSPTSDNKALNSLISDKKIDYPLFFVPSSVIMENNVFVYPSLYLIDKEFNILYSQMGYSTNTEKILDSVITSQ